MGLVYKALDPVLMIGGQYDYVFPVETAQRPLFEHLGTPDGQKQHLLYDMGHGPFPRGQLLRDVLPWLDEHLGPVQ
jgi:alpha-beta hydrolase superfamily lysophospholipase